jgi:hypothetical protein
MKIDASLAVFAANVMFLFRARNCYFILTPVTPKSDFCSSPRLKQIRAGLKLVLLLTLEDMELYRRNCSQRTQRGTDDRHKTNFRTERTKTSPNSLAIAFPSDSMKTLECGGRKPGQPSILMRTGFLSYFFRLRSTFTPDNTTTHCDYQSGMNNYHATDCFC